MSENLNRHHRRIYPPGEIQIHAPSAIRKSDSKLSLSAAAELTRAANSKEKLRANFIETKPAYRRFLSGGVVQTMFPTSEYAYGGVMVIAADASLLEKRDGDDAEILETKSLFDYEPAIQIEYYRQIVASIKAEQTIKLPRDNSSVQVMAFENTVATTSNELHRLPRTISPPHAHIVKDGDWIDPSFAPKHSHAFGFERKLLQTDELFVMFEKFWNEYASKQTILVPVPKLQMRQAPPRGYTIDFSIAEHASLLEQSSKVAEILSSHHTVYISFVTKLIEFKGAEREIRLSARKNRTPRDTSLKSKSLKDLVKLQPSYRTYLYYEDGRLLITISPLLFSHVGALDATDAIISRSAEHKQIFTPDELQAFKERLSSHHLRELLITRD